MASRSAPPQPAASASPLQADSQAIRQRAREPAGAHLRLRPAHVVFHTLEACPARLQVKHEPAGPRIAVAWLADRAWIDEVPRRQLQLRPAADDLARQPVAVEREL